MPTSAPGAADHFTEARYEELVRLAKGSYAFARFGEDPSEPHVLWRHDVDLSIHRAVRLAEIEHAAGVRSTFFLFLHSEFYSVLERSVLDRAQRLLDLGHDIGLHFDTAFYGRVERVDQIVGAVARERDLLADLFGVRPRAISFHNPALINQNDLAFDDDEIGGMVNAYGRGLRERYAYVSDSNGYWRHRELGEVLAAREEPRLQVLTHPGWWQATPMAPRARVVRCAEGRCAATLKAYDAALASGGRLNLG